jgi:hypothetical protein
MYFHFERMSIEFGEGLQEENRRGQILGPFIRVANEAGEGWGGRGGRLTFPT